MDNKKGFINIILLGLSLILSWSLVDYFAQIRSNNQLAKAQTGMCEYVKWPGAETNSVPVSYDTSTAVMVTSSGIYIKSGNVGIGTKNPQYKLDVIGTTSVSALCLGGVCRSNWPTEGTNYWQLNGNNLYPSSRDYNVGIGTTSVGSGHKLTVDGISRMSDIWANYLVVTPTSLDDKRGIYFNATDTGLHIYRERPKWTIITNPLTSSEGIGFKIGNNDIILSIKKRSQLITTMTGDSQVITVPIGSSDYNVGIGTDNPLYKLDVAGNLRVNSGNIINEAPKDDYPYGFVIKTGNNWRGWARQFAVIGPNDQTLGGIVFRGSNSSTLDYIGIGKGISSSGNITTNTLVITSGGRVGIGTTNPQADLHIERPGQPDSFQLGDSESLRIRVQNYFLNEGPARDAVIIEKTDDDPIVEGGIVFGFSTSTNYDTPVTSNKWAKGFYSVMTIRGEGNVGIGTENPQYKLDVIGTTSVSALCLGGVCRSNWPTGLGGGDLYWKFSQNSLFTSSTNWNVGIGTSNPLYKLDVAGNLRVNSGNIINEAPKDYPYGFVIKTGNNWSGWARQFAVIGPNDQTLGGIVFRGSNSSTLDYIGIGEGISASGKVNNFLTIRKSGNVGIGTENPQYKLDVIGTTSVSALCLGGVCRSNWPTGLGGGDLYWKFSQNSLFTSSTNWNVGIGTSNPAEKLTVAGNILVLPSSGWQKNGDSAKISIGDGYNYVSSIYGQGLTLGAWGNIIFKNHESKELMTITSEGNVGIGAKNPRYKLDVIGTTSVSALCLGGVCRSNWPTGLGGGDLYWKFSQNSLFTSSTNWNVGIGTDNPLYKLDVAGNLRVNSGNIINEAPKDYPYGFVIKTGNNWSGWARQFAVIGPNDQTLGGIVFRGSNSSTLDYIGIGEGISASGKVNNFLTIRNGIFDFAKVESSKARKILEISEE